MSRAVLSIGSNLGDRLGYLRSVVDAVADRLVAVSSVYTTAPWGGVEQDDFLNAILVVDDLDRGCREWLALGQRLERAAHRTRAVRWGARTLDVDVIWCADTDGPVVSADPELTVPHPRAHERAFVLIPWLEAEPHARLAVGDVERPVRDWLAALDPAERDGVRRTDLFLRASAVPGEGLPS
ncbi:2-amino-4-hydroxy-6-hydroxymethyldihydropteridine diphosphokinase [Nocardia farcinica]|uniref:2-amino-4-hydroxy-6- hydroxymethyldihydropteridine diphosphokinase n=1 Tax=Nocardia farcinica TaxID=37329 RepID=UPI001894B353|nr:2-amino-4-hydroxy-6-hydroxymethyldihydropteridine diphosphokinase [Nocardia farcinica]MBF6294342.1 2-amino-4-hydroxy-6-hydroxymethyldihydropteridine diphosphokinase [Nocardia farcinica]